MQLPEPQFRFSGVHRPLPGSACPDVWLRCVGSDLELRCVVLEEVSLKYVRQLQKQIGVDTRTVEYLVDIRAITIQLSRKPNHRPLLISKLFFDNLSNKNLAHKIKK